MKQTRLDDPVAAAVVAYCDEVDVPDLDAAAIVSRRREHTLPKERAGGKPWLIAAPVAAMVTLIFVAFNISGVIAEAQRVIAAFTVAAGRTTPLTFRVVDLARARSDMPFAIIVPPPIPGAPIVTIEEMSGDASRANASVIFEIHGTTPGREVMFVETKAARHFPATLLTVRGPEDRELPRLSPLEPRPSSNHRAPTIELHGSFAGKRFAPTMWVAHDTRIAVMSPPGFFTDVQMRAIRRAMSP